MPLALARGDDRHGSAVQPLFISPADVEHWHDIIINPIVADAILDHSCTTHIASLAGECLLAAAAKEAALNGKTPA